MVKPKIIGTGLSGLVGSRIVELLGNDYTFVDFSLETGVDITNESALNQAFEKDKDAVAVLHLAAFTNTNSAWDQRGDKTGLCYRLNVNGTQNLVNLCQKHGQYLINISTDFVFDGTKIGEYTEEDQPNPIEWYGQTKYDAEKVVQDSGLKSSILRISFPYRSQFELKKDIIRKTIDGFKEGKLYPQWTDQLTTTTFIDDIAFGVGFFLQSQSAGVFHLVGSSSQSPLEMCTAIADVFGFDKSLIKPSTLQDYVKNLPPNSRPWQENLSLSNKKVTDLGIKMKTLTEGLIEVKNQLSL